MLIIKLCHCDTLQYDSILNKVKPVSTVTRPHRGQSQVQCYTANSAQIFPFLFSTTYRPNLGYNKSPTLRVLEAASPWTRRWSMKINTPPSNTKAEYAWRYTSIPPYDFIKFRDKRRVTTRKPNYELYYDLYYE